MSRLSELNIRLKWIEDKIDLLLPPSTIPIPTSPEVETAVESTETTATADPSLPSDAEATLVRLEGKLLVVTPSA
jgi:hypothetical protein